MFALQALRAAAAFMVVVDHALVAAARELRMSREHLDFAVALGLVGVKVFFVISGAVMVLSHGSDFLKKGAAAAFLARRASRLLPLYVLVTAITCVLAPQAVTALTLPLSLALIPHQSMRGPYGWPINPLGWTLQNEAFFYLCFALCLLFRKTAGHRSEPVLPLLAVAARAGLLGYLNPAVYLGRPIILYFLVGIGLAVLRQRWLASGRPLPGFTTAVATAAASLMLTTAVTLFALLPPGPAGIVEKAAILCSAAACILSRAGSRGGWGTGI